MTIRHLRIFVAVATTGKMCDAADQLFISQPTVSQAIKELEEYYNSLLFERLGRKLHITKAGKQLLFYATNLLRDFDNIESKMLEVSNNKKIHIGATITIGNCILPDLINEVKKKNSNVRTYSCISNTENIEAQLLNSKLDIAIIEGNINNPNLVTIPALDDSLVLACGKEHPLAKKDRINLEDLKNQDFVLRENGSGTRKLFEDYVTRYNIPINIVLQSNCPGSIKQSIIKNDLLSVISIRLIEEEVLSHDMTFFTLVEDDWKRSLKIVYHKDKFLDPALESLIEIVKNFDSTSKLNDLSNKILVH